MKRTPLRRVGRRALSKQARRAEVVASVMRRDQHQCQFYAFNPCRLHFLGAIELTHSVSDHPVRCGGPLDAHEIIPRSVWPDGELVASNIIVVCRIHHAWIGDHPKWAHELGLHGFSYERPK